MTKTKEVTENPKAVVAGIKGFDANLRCRDFQFEIGKTYRHVGPIIFCKAGFHAVTDHPLAVFDYYPPAGSRFCAVEMNGATQSNDGIKTASEILTIGHELGISDLVKEAVSFVLARSHPEGKAATGDRGAASATGDRGAASATGYQGAASATGYRGAASATGDQGAASATGYQGAASATGDQGAASATGDRGAASATGDRGAAMTSGRFGRVRGSAGNALFAVEKETWDGPIISVACGLVGHAGIAPDTWYRAMGGKLVVA